MASRWVSFATGCWLASLQAGYVLLLETHLTATYLIYFFVVAVWLLGMWLGLALDVRAERLLLGAAAAAFYVSAGILRTIPSDLLLLLVLPSVALGGAYSGQFFLARRRSFPHPAQLFWWENTGFLIGWVLSMLGWLWSGETGLLGGSLLVLSGVLIGRRAG